jgi:hypothetical protein
MRAKRVRPATRRVERVAPATFPVVRVTSASPRVAPASPSGGIPNAQPATPGLSSLPKLRLVARLHVDLLRVASAGCRRFR